MGGLASATRSRMRDSVSLCAAWLVNVAAAANDSVYPAMAACVWRGSGRLPRAVIILGIRRRLKKIAQTDG